MRRKKAANRWKRLVALGLILVLLLAGCAPAAEDSAGSSEDTPTEDLNAPGSEAGAETKEDEAGSDADDSQEEVLSEEDQALLRRSGLSVSEEFVLTDEDVQEIGQAVAGMRAAYVAGPGGEDPLVKDRDWSVYTSALVAENLSGREAELIKRMDKMAMKYLSTSALDGVKRTYSGDSTVYYATEYITYSDIGIGDKQAMALFDWFRYNYPQYYFLDCYVAAGGGRLCGFLYDFAANGKDRAEITNELFDKLDGWIQTVADTAATTYQKELYANNLICETVTYNYDALEEGHDYEMNVCQSLYSTVMLEDTVCAGYSKTFTAMMSALGVEATAGLKSGCHAWNVVHFDDGNYYCVDVCWNDTDRPAKPYSNDYLNVGEDDLWEVSSRGECHTYSDDVASWIPAVAKESYVPTAADTDAHVGGGGDGQDKVPAPRDITVLDAREGYFEITWECDQIPAFYETRVFLDSDCTEEALPAQIDQSNRMSFSGDIIQPGAVFYIRIRSVGWEDHSDWAYATVTIPGADVGAEKDVPAAPANVSVTASGEEEDEALMVWDPVPGASVYEICVYGDSAYSEILEGSISSYPADEGEYLYWTGLREGGTYYFGVRAGKEANGKTVYSNWSNISYTHTAGTGA